MKWFAVAAALFLHVLAQPSAHAALTRKDIEASRFEPRPGTLLPLALKVQDSKSVFHTLGELVIGKPALVLFVDYGCRTLCGVASNMLAARLEQAGLAPGEDYRVVVFGFNPKSGVGDAQAFASRYSSPITDKAFTYLVAEPQDIERLSHSVGFNAVYDAENDQYAHPAGVITVDPRGRIERYLDVVTTEPRDLRLSLVEAGDGRAGSFADQLILVCYGWDAARGIYAPLIHRILTAGGLITVLLIGGGLFIAFKRERIGRAAAKRGQ